MNQTTSASSTTSSSSSSTTIIIVTNPSVGQNVAGSAQRYDLEYVNDNASGIISLTKPNGIIYPHDNIMRSIDANFTSGDLQFQFSVVDSGQNFSGTPLLQNSYKYIQINGSLIGNSVNIDQYVSNVTYNFSVPISWVASQGGSNGNVKLYKYYLGSWNPLSTTFTGYNSTYYFYSAQSASFSYYSVAYATSNVVGTSSPLSLTASSNYGTIFWGVGAQASTSAAAVGSGNWIQDANEILSTGTGNGIRINQSSIGHSPGANVVGKWTMTNAISITLDEMSANVLFSNAGAVVNGASLTNTVSISYPVNVPGSFVVLVYADGGSTFSAVNLPANGGCTIQQTTKQSTTSEVVIANCITTSANTFTTNALATGIQTAHGLNLAAYVFPPYNVILLDNPVGGNIILGGTTSSNGVTVNALGTTSINAIAPGGGYSFNSWVVSSSANLIIVSPSSINTVITVEGGGTITATWTQLCTISLSNTLVGFGTQIPGATFNTNQLVIDKNNGGVSGNILLEGQNWGNGITTFGVGNTLWSTTSQNSYSGTALTNSFVTTGQNVPANGGSNNIYFGLGIPLGLPPLTYTQNIIIENTC